jgi:hypothetical protein
MGDQAPRGQVHSANRRHASGGCAGFVSIHLLATAKSKNDFNRSSFFPPLRAPSFQLARNSVQTGVSISCAETPLSSANRCNCRVMVRYLRYVSKSRLRAAASFRHSSIASEIVLGKAGRGAPERNHGRGVSITNCFPAAATVRAESHVVCPAAFRVKPERSTPSKWMGQEHRAYPRFRSWSSMVMSSLSRLAVQDFRCRRYSCMGGGYHVVPPNSTRQVLWSAK